jgi:hypothetical protein
VQDYNTEVAVEPLFQLVVGQTVTQAANDKQQVVPLIEAIEEQSGQRPKEVLTDSGYCSEENLKYLAKRSDVLVGLGGLEPPTSPRSVLRSLVLRLEIEHL